VLGGITACPPDPPDGVWVAVGGATVGGACVGGTGVELGSTVTVKVGVADRTIVIGVQVTWPSTPHGAVTWPVTPCGAENDRPTSTAPKASADIPPIIILAVFTLSPPD